jgi:hypothetical protein
MAVRGKTRNDPPMQKSPKGPAMFAASDSGAKPHRELLKSALRTSPSGRVGGKRTITR